MQRSRVALVMALGALIACTEDGAPAHEQGDAALQADAAVAVDAGAEPPPQGLRLELEDGELEGEQLEGARRFLNIPYAKPPLGELRWKAPVPNAPWSGVRRETEFVKSCPQLADQGAPASDNEDCLYLNVWTPDPAPTGAPVMVWIHGGGNFSGGAGIPIPTTMKLWYDGQYFASRQGVVLVSVQYRLGPLGFFAHPALAAEGSPSGNQGLLDQRLALTWVKKNIAKFGGDPGNVTIFGESAGAADVCYHVAAPGSRGLFQRAISQSGGCTIRSVGAEQPVAQSAGPLVAYAEAVGCPAGPDQLACLRQKPIAELLAKAMQPMPGAGEVPANAWSFAAVIDGSGGFLPDAPQRLFDRGEIADVPYLLGANHDEGTTFVLRAAALTNEAEYRDDLTKRYGRAAPEVAALYPASDFGGNYNAARARVIGDASIVCGTYDTALRAAKHGRAVFLYNFNVAWSIAPAALLAGHAAELSHVFGAPHLPNPDAASEQVAQHMNRYWARFARTGDPNGPDAPAQWPRFEAGSDLRLQLAPDWGQLKDFRSRECAFWRKYHGAL
ncbi:MAG TPA: carboxylesterase family protein [Polyangiales bacterium]